MIHIDLIRLIGLAAVAATIVALGLSFWTQLGRDA